ncbi:MAG TPA: hypothetical protein VFP34_13975 [Microlunatus sp.]|nr:hypothetical protein [Microlunatus sp.]
MIIPSSYLSGGPRERRQRWIVPLITALLLALAGCRLFIPIPDPSPSPTASASVTTPAPTPDHSSTTPSPAPEPPSTTTPPAPQPEPTDSSTSSDATAEIWFWALGRNVWTDPALIPYTGGLGYGDTDVNLHAAGVQLALDPQGTVTSVTVYNDENALGYPGSETNFSAYAGMLPLGLTWSDDVSSVDASHALVSESGGFGTEIVHTFVDNGLRIDVTFTARHSNELPGASIHGITVAALS